MNVGGLFLLAMGAAPTATAPAPAGVIPADDVSLSTTTLWSAPLGSPAAEAQEAEIDAPSDGEWLIAPIPFKSSMLGVGLKLAVARLYERAGATDSSHQSMFGVGGMYAEGGTWAAGAFDRRYWDNDRWRTTVAAATGELNYDMSLSQLYARARLPVSQHASGGLVAIECSVLPHVWIGGGAAFSKSAVGIGNTPAAVDNLLSVTYQSRSLRLSGEWDSRSDSFFPVAGTLATLDVDVVRNDAAGRSTRFTRYNLTYNGYRSIGANQVFAWRGRFATVSGDAPFFALPWFGAGADLRGYSAGRYIGRTLGAVQGEWRWQAFRKLGFVAFAGIGGVYGEVAPFEQDDALPAAGVGLRWRLTHENRINFAVDYARGRDDQTLTVSVGEAF